MIDIQYVYIYRIVLIIIKIEKGVEGEAAFKINSYTNSDFVARPPEINLMQADYSGRTR